MVGRQCFSGCSISEIDFAAVLAVPIHSSWQTQMAATSDRRVIETHCEHTVEGMLEGCLLAGPARLP